LIVRDGWLRVAVLATTACLAAPFVLPDGPAPFVGEGQAPGASDQAGGPGPDLAAALPTAPSTAGSAPASPAQASKVAELLASGFTENRGQFGESEVRFVGTAAGMRVGLAPSGLFLFIPPSAKGPVLPPLPARPTLVPGGPAALEAREAGLVHIEFVGARLVEPRGSAPLPFPSNYFLGRGPGWTNVPTFGEVLYPSLYQGIDLAYRMTPQGPKYEFRVAAGADETAITLRYTGARAVEITGAGDLLLHTSAGDLVDSAPTALEGESPTRCSFALAAPNDVSFRCQRDSPDAALTIDPLVYSTFLGGTGGDGVNRVVVGPSGRLLATGSTGSDDFPTSLGALYATAPGGGDAFVLRLNDNGSGLDFATYLGGSGYEVPWGLGLDGNGSIFVSGYTYSDDFPKTANSLYSNVTLDTGNSTEADVFVTRLSSSGTLLDYSTYLGGSGADMAYDMAVDSGGSAYVVGETASSDFPTTNGSLPFDPARFANGNPAFVAKIAPNGDALEYCTFLSGTDGDDLAYAVEVDAAGQAFVAGDTTSSDFPTTSGAYDTQRDGTRDGFLTKLSENASAIVYSTFLGGSDNEGISGLDLGANGTAHVVGATASSDFPSTSGAYDTNASNGTFVSRFDANGTSLLYSTFLGVSGLDVAVSSTGYAYVVGYARAAAPVTPDAVNWTHSGNNDGYLGVLDAGGSDLLYGSFLGGTANDLLRGVDVDANGTAYFGGGTLSSRFPVSSSAFQQSYAGSGDGVLGSVDFPAEGEVRVLTDPPGLELDLNGTRVFSNATLNCTARTNLTLSAPSPQGSNDTRYVFENWSDRGTQNHTSRCFVGAVFIAHFSMQHRVNISASPAGRNLTVDGVSSAGPQSYWWVNGSSHGLNVTSPQPVANGSRYVFSGWSDGGAMNRTVTVEGPLNLTATFTLEHLVELWTSPAGRELVLDSAPAPAPQSNWWADGSTHYLSVDSPQVVNDTRYLFLNWSDGGARNRTLVVSGPLNMTANLTTEHLLRLATLPDGRDLIADGVPVVAPRSFWWLADSDHVLNISSPQVVGDTRYVFANWSDGVTADRAIRMSGPLNLTANFTTEHLVRLTTLPDGRDLTVDGAGVTAPQSFWWQDGSRHVLNTSATQLVGDTRYLFVSWSNGRAINHAIIVAGPLNLTANFNTEHRASVATVPAGRQVVVDGVGVAAPWFWWWAEGSNHTFDVQSPQAVSTTRYQFVSWSDGGPQRHSTVVTAPFSLTATFAVEHLAELVTSPSGLEVLVDGVRYPTPASLWWLEGSLHDVEAPSPQPSGDLRYVFANWSNGGASNQSLAGASPFRLTASYSTEYNVTFDTVPAGLLVLVDGVAAASPATFWWAAGAFHTIGADSPQVDGDIRWSFLAWSDSGARSHQVTVGAPRQFSATFQAEYLVTFDTDPPGLPLEIDGSAAPAPRSFWWRIGESHQLGAQATVADGGARHLFSAWSDDGDRVHTVVVAGAGRFVATFTTEYQLRISTDPEAFLRLTVDGVNVTAPTTVWWASGSVHRVAAPSPQGTGNSRHVFRGWANETAPQDRTFTTTAAANLTALFDLEFLVNVATTPAGLSVTVDGVPTLAPAALWWKANTTHTLDLEAEQTLGGARYRFDAWSQGGLRAQSFTAGAPIDLRASFVPAASGSDSGGFGAMIPIVLVVAAAGAGLALVLVRRRRSAAPGSEDEAAASAAALHALTDGSAGAPAAAAGAETTVPADAETVPCPQCEYPIGVGVTPCPNCGLDLLWQ